MEFYIEYVMMLPNTTLDRDVETPGGVSRDAPLIVYPLPKADSRQNPKRIAQPNQKGFGFTTDQHTIDHDRHSIA